jgi:hypothetical protein
MMRSEWEVRELINYLLPTANKVDASQSRQTARNLVHTLQWVLGKDNAFNPIGLLGEWTTVKELRAMRIKKERKQTK